MLTACTDKGRTDQEAGGGSAGGSAGGRGDSAGAGGSDFGNAGSSTGGLQAGASGSAGAATRDCSGEFGEPVLVLEEPPAQLSSVSVTADELELFYVRGDSTTGEFVHSVRATKESPFASGVALSELNLVCSDQPQRFSDMTDDGLGAYFSCTRGYDSASPLRHAQRQSRADGFEVAEHPIGQVGASISIADGELTAFSSAYAPYPGPPRQYSRPSLGADFGADQDVSGLEAATMSTPDLSSDGLTLYGASNGSIVAAHRPTLGDPFAAPETLFASSPTVNYGSPTITADCRALYFVRVMSGTNWSILVARR